MEQTMNIGDRGKSLIRRWEGLRLRAYQDGGGVWTIGYGHTGPAAVEGNSVSLAEAERLLDEDIAWAVEAVNRRLSVPVTQSAFDALVVFCFNIGEPQFASSTLLRKLNAGLKEEVPHELTRWIWDNGRRVWGLTRRRADTAALFCEDEWRV